MQNAKTLSAKKRDTVPKDVKTDTMDLPVILGVLQIVKNRTVIEIQDIVSTVNQVSGAMIVHQVAQCIVLRISVTKLMVNAHMDAHQESMETIAIEIVV